MSFNIFLLLDIFFLIRSFLRVDDEYFEELEKSLKELEPHMTKQERAYEEENIKKKKDNVSDDDVGLIENVRANCREILTEEICQ